jgi:hypothetical protein
LNPFFIQLVFGGRSNTRDLRQGAIQSSGCPGGHLVVGITRAIRIITLLVFAAKAKEGKSNREGKEEFSNNRSPVVRQCFLFLKTDPIDMIFGT